MQYGFRKHKHSWTEVEDRDNEYQKVENPFTKEKRIYDILHSLYVDDTDCTKCQSFTYCMMHGTECLYHEDFELNDDDKEFLTKNGLEIYETNDGWHLHIDDDKYQTTIAILIKYVHELQNAYFVATKKELEIKL